MPLALRAPVIPASSAGTQRHDQSRRNLPPRPPTPPQRTPPSPPTSHASALSRLPFLPLLLALRFFPIPFQLTCPLRHIRPGAQDSPAPQKIRPNCLSPARTPSGGSGWRETVPPFTPTLGPRPVARSGAPETRPAPRTRSIGRAERRRRHTPASAVTMNRDETPESPPHARHPDVRRRGDLHAPDLPQVSEGPGVAGDPHQDHRRRALRPQLLQPAALGLRPRQRSRDQGRGRRRNPLRPPGPGFALRLLRQQLHPRELRLGPERRRRHPEHDAHGPQPRRGQLLGRHPGRCRPHPPHPGPAGRTRNPGPGPLRLPRTHPQGPPPPRHRHPAALRQVQGPPQLAQQRRSRGMDPRTDPRLPDGQDPQRRPLQQTRPLRARRRPASPGRIRPRAGRPLAGRPTPHRPLHRGNRLQVPQGRPHLRRDDRPGLRIRPGPRPANPAPRALPRRLPRRPRGLRRDVADLQAGGLSARRAAPVPGHHAPARQGRRPALPGLRQPPLLPPPAALDARTHRPLRRRIRPGARPQPRPLQGRHPRRDPRRPARHRLAHSQPSPLLSPFPRPTRSNSAPAAKAAKSNSPARPSPESASCYNRSARPSAPSPASTPGTSSRPEASAANAPAARPAITDPQPSRLPAG